MGRYAARRGELRFGLLGDGLFGRLLLLVVRLGGGNPLLLLDSVDVELARQRPIVVAPTPVVAELELLVAADEDMLLNLSVNLTLIWA